MNRTINLDKNDYHIVSEAVDLVIKQSGLSVISTGSRADYSKLKKMIEQTYCLGCDNRVVLSQIVDMVA